MHNASNNNGDTPTTHRIHPTRRFPHIADESVASVATRRPDWKLKRYNDSPGQFGTRSGLREFLNGSKGVGGELPACSCRLGGVCVVGDVCPRAKRMVGTLLCRCALVLFALSAAKLGFDNLQPDHLHKISNAAFEANTSNKFLGKPYEPNAIVQNDIEFILMQRKPGYRQPTEEQRRLSMIPRTSSMNGFARSGR